MSYFLGKIKSLAKSKLICCLFTALRLPHGTLRQMFSDWGCHQWRVLTLQVVTGPTTQFRTALRAEKQQIMDVEGSHLSERSWSGI